MIFAVLAIITVFLTISVIVAIFSKKTDNSESKGEQGEHIVAEALGDTVKGEQYVINDIIFKTETGNSCQIDHIFINKFGIWVIETKNWSGLIFGQENQREWTQVLAYGNTKNALYNPIKQNATHIYHLSKFLKVNNIFQNVVVFLPHADISNINSDYVYSLNDLCSIKNKITSTALSVDEMEHYYDLLSELKNNSTVSREEHIENIHKMQTELQQGICPRCGGNLVLRDGQHGPFYGCSNYPKCKFTKNIE